jgi:tetratricopeptide (TPR) repeat protein
MGGLGEWVWIASFWSAFLDIWCGKPARAEEILRPGYDSLKRLGSKSHFTSLAHALASATYAQGRYDEAEQLAIECKEMCRPNDIHSQVLWRSIRAKVQARRGLFREAELLAREAVAYASTSDFLPAHADALADLAEVLLLKGDEDNAGETLQEAIRLYELKGNTLAAAQARLLPRGLSMH